MKDCFYTKVPIGDIAGQFTFTLMFYRFWASWLDYSHSNINYRLLPTSKRNRISSTKETRTLFIPVITTLGPVPAAARLLRLWVRIPPGAWVSVFCECCVLSGTGLCDGLITRPEESYRLCCVDTCGLETSWMRRPWPAWGRSARGGGGYTGWA
jgi:hypothetical protein